MKANRAKVIGNFYNLNPVYPNSATKEQKEDEKRLKERCIDEVSSMLVMTGMVKGETR